MDFLRKKYRYLLSYLCIFFLLATMMPAVSFAESKPSDVANHWAKAPINRLIEQGIVKGYPDGSFKPDSPITRAEFTAMLKAAFQFTEQVDLGYNDVNITRQEAAYMVMKAKQLKENPSAVEKYKDAAKLPAWSKGAVSAVLDAEIMSGYSDSTFRGGNFITRAEAVVAIENGYHYRKYTGLVLKNGMVYSVNSTDKNDKGVKHEALVIKDGIIAYVGSNAGADKYVREDMQVIDLGGRMVLPGFSDAHAHAKAMAANLFDLNLYNVAPKGYASAIKDWYDQQNPKPTYITGNGWDTLIADQLSKEILDAIPGLKNIPIVLYDSSHHMAWANSKALSLAGIDKDTPNPPGGLIARKDDGSSGEPTGIFHEDSGIGLVLNPDWDNTVAQYEEGILAYQAMANSYGITLNQDPQLSENAIKAYENLAKAGKLTMRVRGGFLSAPLIAENGEDFAGLEEADGEMDAYIKHMKALQANHQVGDLFKMGFVKIYGDGGGPTTFMKNPANGFGVWPQDQLELFCDKLQRNGFQIHGHSMGDAALAAFLDAFEKAGGKPLRNAITHLQFVDDGTNGGTDDAARMAALGVIGIPQPFWMIRDPYYPAYWTFAGEDIASESYPMKSLIDKGVIMAGGSDWPVTIPNAPLISIQSGVTRTLPYDNPDIAYTPDMAQNPMYQYPLNPTSGRDERVDVRTMIQSVTINGAYATFLEDVTGSIQVGKSADLVVLEKDIFQVDDMDISKTNVLMTLFQGDVVYQAPYLSISDRQLVIDKFAPSYPGSAISIKAKAENRFAVTEKSKEGYTIVLDKPVSGLTAENIYLLRDSNKVSAVILSVEDVNRDGKTYRLKAKDLDKNGMDLMDLNGKHWVYVYSDRYDFGAPKAMNP